jgi:hypothetical protein
MEYLYAFDNQGIIKGSALADSVDQGQKWADQGLYVLRGPEVNPKLYKYIQSHVDGSWDLTAKSNDDLVIEAQAKEAEAQAKDAKEEQKAQEYAALPTEEEIKTVFTDEKQQKIILSLAKVTHWLALGEGMK